MTLCMYIHVHVQFLSNIIYTCTCTCTCIYNICVTVRCTCVPTAANLLIDYNCQRLKVADFGCAELLEECCHGKGCTGNKDAGTLWYNPPQVSTYNIWSVSANDAYEYCSGTPLIKIHELLSQNGD